MTSDNTYDRPPLSREGKRLLLLDLWEDLAALEAFAEGRPSLALRSPPPWSSRRCRLANRLRTF